MTTSSNLYPPLNDSFHKWLAECPNEWVRVTYDKDSSTYMFYRNDDQ